MPIDVAAQIASWRSKLLDLTKRNRLVNCKLGPRAALELLHPTPEAIWQHLSVTNEPLIFPWKTNLVSGHDPVTPPDVENADQTSPGESVSEARAEQKISVDDCLRSPRIKNNHLLTTLNDNALGTRLKRLALNAQTSIEEQGVNILFVGFGLLEWFESPDSEVVLLSPVILLPVKLTRPDSNSVWQLVVEEDEVIANQCLQELLKASFGFELPSLSDSESDADVDPFQYFDKIRKLLQEQPFAKRWRLTPKVILGTFSFQKVAMWEDLGKNVQAIAAHGMCRAVAGDTSGLSQPTDDMPDPSEFDERIHPREVHSILDNDSSQMEAILAARHGTNLVVDGPPGTGKSQTIANIIAESLADGKKVLFVSEKVAALEVVKRRLDERRLGDFCLECHSHKANKKDVIAELSRCLALPMEGYRDQTRDLDRLQQTRSQLNAYVQAVHRPYGDLELKPFEAHGHLARLAASPTTRSRLPNPLTLTETDFRAICELLARLGRCQPVSNNFEQHPWRGATLDAFSFSLQDEIRRTFTSLASLIESGEEHLSALQQLGLLKSEPTRQCVLASLPITSHLISFPVFPTAWFSLNPAALIKTVHDLNGTEQELDQLVQSAAEFDLISGSGPDTGRLAHISGIKDSPTLNRIRTANTTTIRTLRSQLESVQCALVKIQQEVEGLSAASDRLGKQLTVRIPPESTIGRLHKLNQIGTIVSNMGPLNAAWFDNEVRRRLLRVASQCSAEVAACEETLKTKAEAWTPLAFQDAGKEISLQARNFELLRERLWGRIVGSWYHFRARASEVVYRNGCPGNAQGLLRDMATLRDYHRRQEFIRQEEATHRDSLLFDSLGCANWTALHAGVDAIEQLQAIVRIPDRLKQALSGEEPIDRDALRTIAETIKGHLDAIDAEVATLAVIFSVAKCGPNNGTHREMSCSDFATWLKQTEQTVAQLLDDVIHAESALRPDKDLPIAEIARRSAQISQIRECRRVAEGLRQELSDIPGVTSTSLVDKELARLRPEDLAAFQRLHEFLETYHQSSPAFVAIVTSGEAQSLARKAEEGLRQLFETRVKPQWDSLGGVFPLSESVSTGVVIERMPLSECVSWLRSMAADVAGLTEWIDFKDIQARLKQFGLESVIEEVSAGDLTLTNVVSAFQASFYRSWLDHVYQSDPVLKGFRIDEHEATVATFQKLDRDFVHGSYKRIRRRLLEHPDRPRVGGVVPPSSELGILLRQASRKRKLMPIRQLFRSIPSILQRLKPCVMMSPLAVSTFIDSADILFDVVIFDEASQVRPFDAIGAIYRGKQLVVAGDEKQLPPTKFFDRMDTEEDTGFSDEESEESPDDLAEYESILKKCLSLGLQRKRLRWHYRSRRESLIAFSNQFFYGNELVTFPSVLDAGSCAVRSHHVAAGRWLVGKEGGYNPIEARETASLIVQHFDTHPDRSLGVITFNQRQQTAVQDEMAKIWKQWPGLESQMQDADSEALFIKNLETVQGDERDHIILSVGYGYDSAGKFAMRFGPLNQEGGERRLNVAITRARYEVVLVSSIRADAIDLSRTQAQGAKLLRAYLDYAERGPDALRAQVIEVDQPECDSPFEYEVEQALIAEGLTVRRQIGCCGFRIDLALIHPERPGRYVLGIECDGATYHGSKTARDRDRLRQEVLEGLQWKIVRVWSTDWVRDPRRQIQRIVSAYEDQLQQVEQGVAATAVDPNLSQPTDSNEERPILKMPAAHREAPSLGYYSNIDEVPENVLRQAVVELLRRFGQTNRDELLRAVARQLGFQRTGRRIQDRVGGALDLMIAGGDLASNEEGYLSVG